MAPRSGERSAARSVLDGTDRAFARLVTTQDLIESGALENRVCLPNDLSDDQAFGGR